MGAFARISMIGWLQGRLSETWQQGGRCGLLLICQGVGYELQLSQRHWQRLPAPGAELSLHVHHSIRDDGWTLFGFADRIERDLFRELLAVSGVGPQAALGLLGTLEPRELVSAVVRSDLRRLCQAPGVGKRTAERLAVELRQRFRERFVALVEMSCRGRRYRMLLVPTRWASPWRPWATRPWRSIGPCGPWPPQAWPAMHRWIAGSGNASAGCPEPRLED
jgi:Holliday junction DNA helicase RuvA subunit